MLFDIPYNDDWLEIGNHRQQQIDQSNIIEHGKWIDFDYSIGTKVVRINNGIHRKVEDKTLVLIL